MFLVNPQNFYQNFIKLIEIVEEISEEMYNEVSVKPKYILWWKSRIEAELVV